MILYGRSAASGVGTFLNDIIRISLRACILFKVVAWELYTPSPATGETSHCRRRNGKSSRLIAPATATAPAEPIVPYCPCPLHTVGGGGGGETTVVSI